MVFFFVLFFHCLFCLVQALGLNQYACGWINGIEMFSTSPITGIVMLLSGIAFSLAFAGMVIALIKVHRLYRGAGFSIDKARQEFSQGVVNDRNVQQVYYIDILYIRNENRSLRVLPLLLPPMLRIKRRLVGIEGDRGNKEGEIMRRYEWFFSFVSLAPLLSVFIIQLMKRRCGG
jgi:hypothetical protein